MIFSKVNQNIELRNFKYTYALFHIYVPLSGNMIHFVIEFSVAKVSQNTTADMFESVSKVAIVCDTFKSFEYNVYCLYKDGTGS